METSCTFCSTWGVGESIGSGERQQVSNQTALAVFSTAASRGDAAAVVTAVRAPTGSPISEGERLCVDARGQVWSTWNDPALEAKAVEDARRAIFGAGSGVKRYELNQTPEPLEVFIEVAPEQPKILIVGAGHIGQALAKLGKIAGFRIVLLDDRPEWANHERAPEADEIICADFEEALAAIHAPATAITLITRGHRQDAVSQQVIRSPALPMA
jgi:xanthine dehydrogenase accessory factor